MNLAICSLWKNFADPVKAYSSRGRPASLALRGTSRICFAGRSLAAPRRGAATLMFGSLALARYHALGRSMPARGLACPAREPRLATRKISSSIDK